MHATGGSKVNSDLALPLNGARAAIAREGTETVNWKLPGALTGLLGPSQCTTRLIPGTHFLKLKKETDFQVQKAQRVPNKINPKRSIPRHIIIKMAKVKENFKGSKRKTKIHKQGNPHKAIR